MCMHVLPVRFTQDGLERTKELACLMPISGHRQCSGDRVVPGLLHCKENDMPRGDKSSYTSKQKRQAKHIEDSYKKRGTSSKTAAKRAWATVNKETGGGKKGKSTKKAAKKSSKKK